MTFELPAVGEAVCRTGRAAEYRLCRRFIGMPYVLISTQIRLEWGPTLCGDEESDPLLMTYLNATLQNSGGNPFQVYSSPDRPRKVLNKLAELGYRVVASSGVGQTCIWTLFADSPSPPPPPPLPQ